MTIDTTTIIQFVLGKNSVPWDRLQAALQPLHETLDRIERKLDKKVDKP